MWLASGSRVCYFSGAMNKSRYVFDATAANFQTLVLENSIKGPVLVHFWSPRAGPCMLLMPRLVKLTTEYGGKLLLVMVNTDEQGRMAKELGVTSVPTVKFFRQGKVVHTIHGADPDAEFRKVIDKYVARDSDRAHAIALRAYQEGDIERSCTLLAQVALDDPSNPRIPVDLAKLLMLKGDYAQAEDLLTFLPTEMRDEAEIGTLLAHVGFIRIAQDAPDTETLEQALVAEPDNSLAHYQLSALKLIQDDYEGAMAHLLEIVKRDRAFRDDAGRKGLISLFSMLGNEGELVARYRALLSQAMN